MPRLLECAVQLLCQSTEEKKMTVPLRISSASNLILALIVLLVQSMILKSYNHLNITTYSQYTGVGIWTALLLACNGISMLLYLKRKFLCEPSKMLRGFRSHFPTFAKKKQLILFLIFFFSNKNRYMASVVLCVAALLAGIVMAGLASAAFYGLLLKSTKESPLPQTAFVLAQLDDEFTSLKVLEGTLFGCGLASIFVNALSILFLRLNSKIISHEAVISSSSLSTSNANRY
ncbi:uncharacterized protein LOC124194451 isoform X1 [Daphnia pulex]|uniref:uncharacterized protein LOC124194451 isoform X1 n=1 Tax=Daphnia pulex TaxID=6669 RepID=UPI001EDD5C88|nr:uncharacterized protein LOC124194451 isoform X1 [Daphnia pulex]